MAASLQLAEFTYSSGAVSERYLFTIGQDSEGNITVRDIQDPYGFVISPYTKIPKSVSEDIEDAIAKVETIMSLTSSVNGTLEFAAEHEKTVTFVEAFSNATYRVQLSSEVFSVFKISNKTIAGFKVQAAADITGDVGYDVFA